MRASGRSGLFARYATAWVYLIAVTVAELVYATLSRHDQAALLRWASTNVHNLRHDPIGCLIVSAFLPSEFAWAWPAVIALAMFGACQVLGNWRTVLVCGMAHVIGTLVSEGIVAYRVVHGGLPAADKFLTDVGPSYVVVSAIVVAILYGSWLARAAAALDLALLVFIGDIFSGLSRLNLSAVGHVTAMVVGGLLGSLLVWQQRRSRRASSDSA
jgi:Rhomboid-like protein